jgi:XTP/dITP diphosphohydrolase
MSARTAMDSPQGPAIRGTATSGTPGATGSAGAAQAALAELVEVVDRLRDPEHGCPWDLQQTHASLIPFVLEEAHEVADAIRHGDDRHLEEELGDLLLQVVLHARIAAEAGRFDLERIARGITAKLVRRHPHVFASGDGDAAGRGSGGDSEAVRRSWEAIKAREKAEARAEAGAAGASTSPLSEALAGKVRGQPPLAGAMTISRKAAAAGFEWDDLDGVWAKVHEELDELKEAVAAAMAGGDRGHAQEELGDVLFTLVNVARWCGIDPQEGLAGTNRRFLDRFSRVEAALGGDLGGRSLRELEGHWQQAKAEIRREQPGPQS